MAVIMFGSVLLNKPFTAQYTNKGEHRLHLHLSTILGALLLIAALISIAHAYLGLSNTMSIDGTVLVILIGKKANSVYPKWYYQK